MGVIGVGSALRRRPLKKDDAAQSQSRFCKTNQKTNMLRGIDGINQVNEETAS